MTVIARDAVASDHLVYAWPFPIGLDCEVACSDDEQVVMCPAWLVGDRLGPGRHLWRTPDPSRPSAAYFVLLAPVEVSFDMSTMFLIPNTGQPVRLRAVGSLQVRCADPGLLIAQFVGLPFDGVNDGILRSVSRSVERMLARLLTRRVIMSGTPLVVTDPSMLPQIMEELVAYNPTAGAVFGIELIRMGHLTVVADDGSTPQLQITASNGYGNNGQQPRHPTPPPAMNVAATTIPPMMPTPQSFAAVEPPPPEPEPPRSPPPSMMQAVKLPVEPGRETVRGHAAVATPLAATPAPMPPRRSKATEPPPPPIPPKRSSSIPPASSPPPGPPLGPPLAAVSGEIGGSRPSKATEPLPPAQPVPAVVVAPSRPTPPAITLPSMVAPMPAKAPGARSASTLPPPITQLPKLIPLSAAAPVQPTVARKLTPVLPMPALKPDGQSTVEPAPAVEGRRAPSDESPPGIDPLKTSIPASIPQLKSRAAKAAPATDAPVESRGSIMGVGMSQIGAGSVAGEIPTKVPPGGRVLVPGPNGLMQSATVRQLLSGYYELEVGSSGETIWVPMGGVVPE